MSENDEQARKLKEVYKRLTWNLDNLPHSYGNGLDVALSILEVYFPELEVKDNELVEQVE